MRIVVHGDNHLEAVRGDGEVAAVARRHSSGSLWSVTFLNDPSPAPHVKISRRLSRRLQRELVNTLLEAA